MGKGRQQGVQTSRTWKAFGGSLPRNITDAARNRIAAAVYPSPRLRMILATAPDAPGREHSLHRWRMARAVPMLTSWAKSQARHSSWEQAAEDWVASHLPDWLDSHEELGAPVYTALTGPPDVPTSIDWGRVHPYMTARQAEEAALLEAAAVSKCSSPAAAHVPMTSGSPATPPGPPAWLPPTAKNSGPVSQVRPWRPPPPSRPPPACPGSSSAVGCPSSTAEAEDHLKARKNTSRNIN